MRAVVIERWAILRHGLRSVLAQAGHQVVKVEGSGATGLAAVRSRAEVDVVVLGTVDDQRSATVVAALRSLPAPPLVVVLSDEPDRELVDQVLAAGASGLLGRVAEGTDLVAALERIERGERVLSNEVIDLLVGLPAPATAPTAAPIRPDPEEDLSDPDGPSLLTPREREVLELLAAGADNRQIADRLFIGQSTVKSHLGTIYSKLGASGRHRAVARGFETGLLRDRRRGRLEEPQPLK